MKAVIFALVISTGVSNVFAAKPKSWKITDTALFNFSDVTKDIHQPAASSRNCCAFGYDLSVKFFPPIHINQVVGGEEVNTHKFGNKGKGAKEAQGEVFSCHAGFLDTAHFRHTADWTAYVSLTLEKLVKTGGEIKLKQEGGKRSLIIKKIEEELSKENIVTIAQRISYDAAVWHEILTWFAPAVVPIFSEKHSSFAPEDNFSNLLGTYIAKEVLLSGKPYNAGMVEGWQSILKKYDARSRQEAILAFDWVHDIWWNKRLRMPNSMGVMKRHMNSYGTVTPWTVSGREFLGCDLQEPPSLDVPEFIVTPSGKTLRITDLYEMDVIANRKVPVKEFLNRDDRRINHRDLPGIVEKMRPIVQKEFMDAGFDDPLSI